MLAGISVREAVRRRPPFPGRALRTGPTGRRLRALRCRALPVPVLAGDPWPLETLGILELLAGEQALTSEITAIPTPGHTPGSMGLAIVSGGQRALIIGDVTVNPAQVTEPDWVFAFDMDPAQAVQTRKQMIERAETEDALLIACHFPTWARAARTSGGTSLLAGRDGRLRDQAVS